MIKLDFFIPGLWQPLTLWRKDFAFQPVAQALLRLCAKLSVESSPVQGLENTLFQQSGHPTELELPFAYYRYLLDFGVPPEQALLCADPVYLSSGLDSVILQPNLPVLTMAEMATALTMLNQHLAEDGLQLVARHPQRWYLLGDKVRTATPLRTVALSQAKGQSIFPLLPQGDKRYWHRLLNEIQMLLHTLDMPAMNAVWLWGATNPTALPALQIQTFDAWLGLSPTAQVMALATHSTHQMTASLADSHLAAGKRYAIILDDLHLPSVSDDLNAWQQALDAIEKNWLEPVLAGVQSGKFSVSLTACDGRILHCQPRPAWKIWQTQAATWDQLLECG